MGQNWEIMSCDQFRLLLCFFGYWLTWCPVGHSKKSVWNRLEYGFSKYLNFDSIIFIWIIMVHKSLENMLEKCRIVSHFQCFNHLEIKRNQRTQSIEMLFEKVLVSNFCVFDYPQVLWIMIMYSQLNLLCYKLIYFVCFFNIQGKGTPLSEIPYGKFLFWFGPCHIGSKHFDMIQPVLFFKIVFSF